MNIEKSLAIFIILVLVAFPLFHQAYGHGVGFEILAPVSVGDKSVSLEVQSSQYDNPENSDRQISFSLFNIENGVTIRDVTYNIKALKGNQFLFEGAFQSDNGIFVFNLLKSDSEEIRIEEDSEGSFFDSLIGTKKDVVNVRGAAFQKGGLYNFDVRISTIDSYSNELTPPIEYQVGLSIPDTSVHEIEDLNFGTQNLSLITYYDEIQNFQYIAEDRTLSFSMPFEWSFDIINQTSVVHEEIILPKAFGDLLVSDYTLIVNGIEVPARVITVDDFSEHTRIIHMVLNQQDLFRILEEQGNSADEMSFVLKPRNDDFSLSSVTANGQFRIALNWEPKEIASGSETRFLFDVTDVFLKGRPIVADYELRVLHGQDEIYKTSGTSTGTKDQSDEFTLFIPENVSGPLTIQFENLNGNSLAKVGIPVVVDRILPSGAISIPDWVRNNAGWWAEGQIADKDFAAGIEFLIKNEIIKVPVEESAESGEDVSIPDWVRNNAGWWADGQIADKDFAAGIQFLVSKGIISV